MKKSVIVIAIFLLTQIITFSVVSAQITSSGTGNWSSTTTWTGGVVPTAGSNVTVASGHTITLNSSLTECNNLTISGTVRFAVDGSVTNLTVNGNVTINSGGRLRVESRSPAGTANSYVEHTLNLYGDLTNRGTFDMRGGSTSGGTSVGTLIKFIGTGNSTISLTSTTYLSSTEEFNGITINKTGTAKVILASGNLFMNSSSSVGPSVLTFINGIVETGSNRWITTATGGSSVTGASSGSYVNGILGRGMNSSGESEKKFDIGDGTTYRPISIRTTYGGRSSGHYVHASIITGNAHTGTSTFSGSIDSVSSVRYYKVGYSRGGIATAADSMTFKQFTPTYNGDDNFTQSSLGMHVAYSTNDRATWVDAGPTNHVTDLSIPPTEIQSTAITPEPLLRGDSTLYVAIAHGSGTPTGPIADSTNARYGDQNLQRYDLWKATSASPTPLLVYIHGGGLTSGSKSDISTSLVTKLLAKGISVMSINYRLSPEVVTPQHFMDCARAVQYARYYAAQLNIDPDRIAFGGSSAGALTSFWLGYHDDLADAGNPDPILRMSTRASALICWSGQTSVDSRVVGGWIDPIVLDFTSYFRGTIFGLNADSMSTPTAYAKMEEASPYNYVNAGDPPTWMYYSYVNTPATSSEAIHHIGFGNNLKTKMDSFGLISSILTPAYGGSVTDSSVNFLSHFFTNTALPVELITFTGTAGVRTVSLSWSTASEVNSSEYQIERRMPADARWKRIGTVSGAGTTSVPRSYSFVDYGMGSGQYEYRLKQIDSDGMAEYSNSIIVTVGQPDLFELSQNYPNPFNPSTVIRYQIPQSGFVRLSVFDQLGRETTALVNEHQPAGSYSVQFNASALSGGVYYCRLQSGTFTSIKKMLLLR